MARFNVFCTAVVLLAAPVTPLPARSRLAVAMVPSSRRGLLGASAGGLFGASLWSSPPRSCAADAAPDLSNRIALVTGASGLGLSCGIELAKMGATVVVGCRDEAKGKDTVAKINAGQGDSLAVDDVIMEFE